MKLATLACLAALFLTGLDAHAAPGDPPAPQKAPARSEPARPDAARPKPDAAKGEPAKGEPAKAEPTRGEPVKGEKAEPARPAGAAGRRRRSYAACNRASHQRGYYGGRRRRFLIRCRLGYERTRTPPAQMQGAAPPHPGRRP